MFTPDFERFDLDLTIGLWQERRRLERQRLSSLLQALEGDAMAVSPTLKGLGSKLAKFKHDVEYDAAQLSTEIDAASAETQTTFADANDVLAQHRKDLADVKTFVAEVAAATNGGPALDTTAPAATPVPAAPSPLA